MKRSFYFFIFLLFPVCSFGQTGIFTFYSVNEGLAQSTVTCMYRDTVGYLWVGTGEGLSLFNGYEFKNFKSRINDSNSISNNRIRAIRPSVDGKNIWVGTEDGLNCFSRKDARLIGKISEPEYSGHICIPLYFTDNSYWFLLSSTGIFKKNNNEKKPQLVIKDSYHFKINQLLSPGEFLYQTIEKKLKLFSAVSGKAIELEIPEELKNYDIFNSIEIANNKILIASANGLWQIEKKSGKIERFPFEDAKWNDEGKSISAVCCDNKGRLWMGIIGEGLFVYDPASKKIRPVGWEQSGLSVNEKLKHIMCLLPDPYGIVWAGTDGFGLVKIVTDRIFFGEEYLSPLVTDSCHWFTKSFYKDNSNRLWIGTYGCGLKVIDYNNGTIKTVFPDFQTEMVVCLITAIFPASGNALFIGTTNGLFLLDTSTMKTKRVDWKERTNEYGSSVNCIFKAKDGTVFVGTFGYLFIVKEISGNYNLVQFSKKTLNVSAITENNQGDIIVSAVFKGLYSFEKNGILRDSLIFSENKYLPPSTLINAFCRNGADSWFASSNVGLLEFSNDFKLKKVYTDVDGLPDNVLYGIVELPDHNYFVSTGKGISIFNFEKRKFVNYSEKDGMKSGECNTGALYFSNDKIIYVGGVNGFDFKQFPFEMTKAISPKIYFEKQFDQNLLKDENSASYFQLNYLNNTFSFKLWQTDFTFSDRTTYHYQLTGFDPKIVNSDDRRFVRYAEVDPGEYSFASSISFPGFTSSEMTTLFSVEILPPYWQSTWFRVLSILIILLFIGSAIYFVLHSKYKKRMRKLEMQHELERIRIRISGDIHDDLGAGLTRIALTSDLVSRQLEESNPNKSRITNVAKSARDLSQSLKEVVWSVKPEYDQLDSMVNYFKGYCGELFEDTDISFSFISNSPIPSISVSPEIRRNLFLICKEACNNAMKHSGASKVQVKFDFNNGKILLEIFDNGCGIGKCPTSAEINSSGMKNMEKRAGSIGFKLSVSGNDQGGCSILVTGIL